VEHAYSSERSAVAPWRTAAIVAAAVAAVELFALIGVGVVFGAKLVTDRAEKAIAAPHAAQPAATTESAATGAQKREETQQSVPVAQLARDHTSVIVLNGNGVSGVAAVTAERVRRFHYLIAATGNAPRSDFQRSFVMYRPGFKGEALRLAHDMRLRRVVPLDGMTRRDLQGAHLALIIGG
jgi:LytR cell envelope-related transcriptional attenuator